MGQTNTGSTENRPRKVDEASVRLSQNAPEASSACFKHPVKHALTILTTCGTSPITVYLEGVVTALKPGPVTLIYVMMKLRYTRLRSGTVQFSVTATRYRSLGGLWGIRGVGLKKNYQ